jgi:FAD-dependent urate hydroxylase
MIARLVRHNDCEVIVIGAGPYGLAVAAHLRARDIDTRLFGEPMSFWQRHMPKGMFLRSPWGATHISDPAKALSLDAYVAQARIDRTEPLPLETFVDYGNWFQARAVPDVDRRRVERIEATANGFRAVTADGEAVHAARVVVAMGLANQAFRPAVFAHLSNALTSHSSDHDDFAGFRGKRVAVIGRGQSACESAALLHEAGADVDIICRGPIHWLSYADGTSNWRALIKAQLAGLMATPSGVGPFPLNWVVEVPHLVQRLPADLRDKFNVASLHAGAAGWLRPRFNGVRIVAGSEIAGAVETDRGIEVRFDRRTAVYDHVLLATGYKTDIAKLGILDPQLLGAIACRDHAPVLSGGLESSVPGLHFVGASAVASLGPLMRFIAGTPFAARQVARAVAANRHATQPARNKDLESNLAA